MLHRKTKKRAINKNTKKNWTALPGTDEVRGSNLLAAAALGGERPLILIDRSVSTHSNFPLIGGKWNVKGIYFHLYIQKKTN